MADNVLVSYTARNKTMLELGEAVIDFLHSQDAKFTHQRYESSWRMSGRTARWEIKVQRHSDLQSRLTFFNPRTFTTSTISSFDELKDLLQPFQG